MKTIYHSVLAFLMLSMVAGVSLTPINAQAKVYVSVYGSIPIAPDIVLDVNVPVVAPPAPNYIWIDGFWSWDNYRHGYVWTPGYWAVAPYTNAYWVPGYWESYRHGYRWVEAQWLPRNHALTFGYYHGRYDYYGRPVYYHKPTGAGRHGYAYGYDHRPEYRGAGYSSSHSFNRQPAGERSSINQAARNPAPARTESSTRSSANTRTGTRESSSAEMPTRSSGTNTTTTTRSSSPSSTTTRSGSTEKSAAPATTTRSSGSGSTRSGSAAPASGTRSSGSATPSSTRSSGSSSGSSRGNRN
ncbi:hypothetical protein SAMD00024442_23_21 [Candidatus Symbiothrix dinenymphae]|nr:hypothetical protein SAMD00024442_23_21 [Candidatus Symbiothrix dinenymphae]